MKRVKVEICKYFLFGFQGIKFDPDRYIVNSVKSHLLSQFALENYGALKQREVLELMSQKYFEEAYNLNSDRVLQAMAQEAGIDKDAALAFFTSPTNVKKLFTEIQKLKKKGILGVPYYHIYIEGYNDTKPLAFSGSQTTKGFVETFQKLIKEYHKSLRPKNGR